MKALILAAAVAIGSFTVPVYDASAASVTFSDRGVTVREGDRHYRDRRHYVPRHHVRHCRYKTVKTYRHHRVIYKKIRVCR